MPKLIIKEGEKVIKKLAVPADTEAFTVGCERGNDIIIKDETISFFHLQFEKQNGDYYVRDLQSQWGTFVNNEKISNRTPVHHLDEVRLGKHSIIFMSLDQPAPVLNPARQAASAYSESHNLEKQILGVPTLRQLNNWLLDEDEVKPEFVDDFDSPDNVDFPRSQDFIAVGEPATAPELLVNDDLTGSVNGNHDPENMIELSTPPGSDHITTETPQSQVSDKIPGTAGEKIDNAYIPPYPASHSQKLASPYLLGIYGYYLGRKFKIKTPETRIGRDGKLNDIIIRKNSKGKFDQSISRRHATLRFKNGRWLISDKRSKSRTWVNRHELETQDQEPIKPGDEIEIVSDKKSHIFRMVDDGDWDYSFPAKAGPWHVRNIINLLNAGTAIIVMLALAVLINSYIVKSRISSRPGNLIFHETTWGVSDIDSKLETGRNRGAVIFPATADLNGDGYLDLVYVNNRDKLSCINGKSKEPLWNNRDFQVSPDVPLMLADLLGKGSFDIIAVSKDNRLLAIDGDWGIETMTSPILPGLFAGQPLIADFNSDGLKDFAIAGTDNNIYIGYSTLHNFRWSKIDPDAPIRSQLSAGDVTGDGIINILAGTEDGRVVIADGLGQRIVGYINVNEELNKATGRFDQNNRIRSPVALADLNSDGIEDMVVVTQKGNLLVLAGGSLERLWYDIAAISVNRQQKLKNGLLLGDLDGDARVDVVVQTADGKLRAMKGLGMSKDRKLVLWESPLNGRDDFTGSPVLADFNKNGTLDVVAVSKGSGIVIIEGATGEVLAQHKLAGTIVQSQLLIGDFDVDNFMDIVFLKNDGRFHKLSTNRKSLSSKVLWGQTTANIQHTGRVQSENRSTKKHLLKMFIAILTLISVGVVHFMIRRSRSKLIYY